MFVQPTTIIFNIHTYYTQGFCLFNEQNVNHVSSWQFLKKYLLTFLCTNKVPPLTINKVVSDLEKCIDYFALPVFFLEVHRIFMNICLLNGMLLRKITKNYTGFSVLMAFWKCKILSMFLNLRHLYTVYKSNSHKIMFTK